MKNYVFLLIGLCIVIFIIQSIFPTVTDNFALVSKDVLSRPWIILTSIFLHGDFSHLFYNMFALGLFGFILERIIGSRKILIVYFLAGIVASISSTFFYNAALGASGAIYGILGCLAALRPKMKVWVAYVPMPMIVAAGVWALIDIFGILVPSNVANVAHLSGLGVGIIFGLFLRKKFPEVKVMRARRIPEREFKRWEDRWM